MAEIQSKIIRTEALQYDGTDASGYGIAAWANSSKPEAISGGQVAIYQPDQDLNDGTGLVKGRFLSVLTPSGWVIVNPGDWVIRDTQGYPYPCEPVTFEARWEVLDAVAD